MSPFWQPGPGGTMFHAMAAWEAALVIPTLWVLFHFTTRARR